MVPITESGIPSFYDRTLPIKKNCVAVSLIYRQPKSGTQELVNAESVEMGQGEMDGEEQAREDTAS